MTKYEEFQKAAMHALIVHYGHDDTEYLMQRSSQIARAMVGDDNTNDEDTSFDLSSFLESDFEKVDDGEWSVYTDAPINVYHPDDWRSQAAQFLIEVIKDRGALSGMVKKKIKRESHEYYVQESADIIRLLHEQDNFSREEIRQAFRHLRDDDTFWIPQRNLQSVATLRNRTSAGDRTKFEVIYNKSLDLDGTESPEEGSRYTEQKVDEFVGDGVSRDDFKQIMGKGYDYQYDKAFIFQP